VKDDQPYLNPVHLAALGQAFRKGHTLVVSHYGEGYGVPVVFGKNFTDELLALHDTEGAKPLVAGHVEIAHWVPFPEGHIDLDTPEDVKALGVRYTATSSDTTGKPAF
jgi:molybdenum cofactor cytidylyltransferase